MTIAALLHDLETASAGSRELSDRVLLAMGWAVSQRRSSGSVIVWLSPNGRVVSDDQKQFPMSSQAIPSPTESVDWLLANVPEGWHTYTAHEEWNDTAPKVPWEWGLCRADAENRYISAQAMGATPALALCVAILRAMVAEGRIAE